MLARVFRCGEGRWRILLATLCIAAYGENAPAERVTAWAAVFYDDKPITGLKLDSASANVFRKTVGNEEKAYARIVGTYGRAGWELRSGDKPIAVDASGRFSFLLPVAKEVTRIPLTALGPAGEREEEFLELSVSNWHVLRRELTSLPVLRESLESPASPLWLTGLGADFGASFYIPFAFAQRAVDPSWAIGVRGSYAGTSQSNRRQTGAGAFLDVSYFPGGVPFQGFYLQPKLGLFQVEESGAWRTLPAIALAAGWRPVTTGAFNLGIGVGAHYVFDSDPGLSYTGFFPGLVFDAGIRF